MSKVKSQLSQQEPLIVDCNVIFSHCHIGSYRCMLQPRPVSRQPSTVRRLHLGWVCLPRALPTRSCLPVLHIFSGAQLLPALVQLLLHWLISLLRLPNILQRLPASGATMLGSGWMQWWVYPTILGLISGLEPRHYNGLLSGCSKLSWSIVDLIS